MPDGKVLAAGGYGDTTDENGRYVVSAGSELYDPATGKWNATGNMVTAQRGQEATLLPNGKVLVAGGYDKDEQPVRPELYDPTTGSWSLTGEMINPAREGQSATLLATGKVLVAGGGTPYNPPLNSAELYDPATGAWSSTGPLNIARTDHEAMLLANGKVLVFGGEENDTKSPSSVELYDPISGSWSSLNSLSGIHSRFTATLLPDGRVLIAGGSSDIPVPQAKGELYNPAIETPAKNPLFKAKWQRADEPLVMGVASPPRSWLWGPVSFSPTGSDTEPYLDSPGGARSVLYFDKARMELNNPATGLVTNGLLVRELISGRLATGDAAFIQRHPAVDIPIAGDAVNNDGPTYASFGKIASTDNNNSAPDRTGQSVTETLTRDGQVGTNPDYGNYTRYVYFEGTLKHNIPEVFWNFLNQRGNVYIDGQLLNDQPVLGDNPVAPWLDATGYPISEAYWARVEVAGQSKLVLTQAYERRVLTFTPDNPAGFKVEMGNVGRHYFSWRYDPKYDTTNMITVRIGHAATLLPNGKVLVSGGFGQSEYEVLASAELFDPATGTWNETGSMRSAQVLHTMTLLPNGKVLVVGPGETAAELYDPAAGTWSKTGEMVSRHVHHTTTLLPNGQVLVAGGMELEEGVKVSTELYDPATNTWSNTGNLITERYQHTATLLADGKVLVAGGKNYDGDKVASAELYDPASGKWGVTGSLSTARNLQTATLLANGKVLVAGGEGPDYHDLTSAELYDPATGKWSTTGNLNHPRSSCTVTLLPNGKALVAGGYLNDTAELYDPATGTWTATGNMSTSRVLHTATLLTNGKVLAVGGQGSGKFLSSAELYDPATGNWTMVSNTSGKYLS